MPGLTDQPENAYDVSFSPAFFDHETGDILARFLHLFKRVFQTTDSIHQRDFVPIRIESFKKEFGKRLDRNFNLVELAFEDHFENSRR